MKARLVSILSAVPTSTKVKHYQGAPPELTGGTDTRQVMGSPAFLVIEASPDGVFLYRYDGAGRCVGDTWHMNVDDAKHQANYEYEGLVQDWHDVSAEVEDVAACFGLEFRLRGHERPQKREEAEGE